MRYKQLQLTDYGPAPGAIDAAVEWLLLALLAFMPLVLGAVEPWSESVAIVGTLVLAVLLVLRRFLRPDYVAEWTWAYVPLALYLLAILLQLVTLPEVAVSKVSPETAIAKARLLSDLPSGSSANQPGLTLSFYPWATRHDLRVVLLAVAMFVSVVEVYRRPEQVHRLLCGITCVGAVVASLAVAQQLTSASSIYWTIPTPNGRADAGPFINHNHFAQFMNLCNGATFGLLLVQLRKLDLRRDAVGIGDLAATLQDPQARPVWLCAGVVVVGVVAVFMSMSRGGMIGLIIASAVTAVVMGRRQHLRQGGWVLVLLMLGAFAGVLYAGFDSVYDRLAAIRTHPDATGGRWQLTQDALRIWRMYPLFGTGLGTHAYVFSQYDKSGSPVLASHVENEYVQSLEETGAIGLALILLFVGIVWVNYWQASRARRPRVCGATFGLGWGLLAVMVHSVSDFGQHLPAIAGLSAVVCGLLIVLARLADQAQAAEATAAAEALKPADAPPPVVEVVRQRPIRFVVPAVVMALLGWAVLDANVSHRANGKARKAEDIAAHLAGKGWDGDDEEYTQLLQSAAIAAEIEPDRVEHQYWLNAWRWRAVARERDQDTGDLLFTAETLDHTRRIVGELHAARPLCPTYGPLVSLAGQLEFFVLGDTSGITRIRAGYALAPNHPEVVYAAALADASTGDFDASLDKFRRCVALEPTMLQDVMNVFEKEFSRPDLAMTVAEQSGEPTALLALSKRLRIGGNAADTPVADAARAAAIRLLAERSNQPGVSPGPLAVLARVHVEDKHYEAAIPLYRAALAIEYGQVEWRLELAWALKASGRTAEAIREAQICLRLRPGMAAAERLVGELSLVAPSTIPSVPSRGEVAAE